MRTKFVYKKPEKKEDVTTVTKQKIRRNKEPKTQI